MNSFRIRLLAMLGTALLALLALLLAACGAQAQSPPASQASAKAGWSDIVAQANKEGGVVIVGSGSEEQRAAMTDTFKQKYPQIKVDYTLLESGALTPKLLAEHSANKIQTDILISGVAGDLPLMDGGALADLHPYLQGPQEDESKQLGGKWHFADNAGQHILVFTAYVKLAWAYPASGVDGSQFKSWKDLLDPKWKGKIVMGDPTSPGAGGALAAYWYFSPELGKSYVDQFFKQQDPTFSRDDSQMINAVARGQSQIGLGIGDANLAAAFNKGLPIKLAAAADLAEKPYSTAGNGAIAVMNAAPHPNATKVYLDWMLSVEGQSLWAKATSRPSYRQDAAHEGVFDVMVPKPGREYYETDKEDFARRQSEAAKYVKTLVGS